MILRLLDPSAEPHCRWTYDDPDTHHESKGRSLPGLIQLAELHRTSNGLPVPENFAALVETQICTRIADNLSTVVSGKRDTSCKYRGEVVRTVQCIPCGGGIRIKVLACELHGECTMSGKEIGCKPCWDCRDRTALTS